jgi:hypothetical protein
MLQYQQKGSKLAAGLKAFKTPHLEPKTHQKPSNTIKNP